MVGAPVRVCGPGDNSDVHDEWFTLRSDPTERLRLPSLGIEFVFMHGQDAVQRLRVGRLQYGVKPSYDRILSKPCVLHSTVKACWLLGRGRSAADTSNTPPRHLRFSRLKNDTRPYPPSSSTRHGSK